MKSVCMEGYVIVKITSLTLAWGSSALRWACAPNLVDAHALLSLFNYNGSLLTSSKIKAIFTFVSIFLSFREWLNPSRSFSNRDDSLLEEYFQQLSVLSLETFPTNCMTRRIICVDHCVAELSSRYSPPGRSYAICCLHRLVLTQLASSISAYYYPFKIRCTQLKEVSRE